jgi:hypothetical protein
MHQLWWCRQTMVNGDPIILGVCTRERDSPLRRISSHGFLAFLCASPVVSGQARRAKAHTRNGRTDGVAKPVTAGERGSKANDNRARRAAGTSGREARPGGGNEAGGCRGAAAMPLDAPEGTPR